MIDHLAFDVGGVLLDIATAEDVKEGMLNFLRNQIKVDKNEEELKNIVDICVPAWFAEKDSGFNLWSRFFSPRTSRQIVDQYRYFHDRRYQPIPAMMKLCHQLSQHYQVGILSNFAKEFILEQNFHHQNIFHPIIYSGLVGVKKPDPKIYHIYCQAANCQPSELLFVDDMISNVKSAQSIGMTALLFTDQPQLEADLAKLQILYHKVNSDPCK